jgi:hypothetical protein
MLPVESVRVRGGLRYTIARALLDVDVPPFDSLDDFSETLTRYERGSREQIVRRVLQRLAARRSIAPVYAGDRRRHPHATELRRALREADARLYLQKVAGEAPTVTVASCPAPERRLRGAAACVAAGLLLIVTGEVIDGWHRPMPSSRLSTPAAGAVTRDIALGLDERPAVNEEPRTPNAEPRTPNPEHRTPNPERRTQNPEPRTPNPERRTPNPERSSVKRAVRAPSPRERARKASVSRGVLERLRLNWLRTVFTSS